MLGLWITDLKSLGWTFHLWLQVKGLQPQGICASSQDRLLVRLILILIYRLYNIGCATAILTEEPFDC